MTCYANYRDAKAKILLRAHHQLKQVQTKIFAFRRLFPCYNRVIVTTNIKISGLLVTLIYIYILMTLIYIFQVKTLTILN